MQIALFIAVVLTLIGCLSLLYIPVFYIFGTDILVHNLLCFYHIKSELTSVFLSLSVVMIDWPILILFICTIINLSNKLKRFNKIKTGKNITTVADNIKKVDEKLKAILVKILICSVTMESTFLMAALGDIIITDKLFFIPEILLCIDAIGNVYFTNLMLEHNSGDYATFIHQVSMIFCCCKVFSYNMKPKVAHVMQQSHDHEMTAVSMQQKANSSHMESTYTDNTNNQHVSTFGVENIYSQSQASKEETLASDPL